MPQRHRSRLSMVVRLPCPAFGAMSQRGQQYLTNQILGPGQYSAQNLGFTDYTAPEEGTGYGQRWPSPDWGYEVNEEPITGRTAVRRPRTPGGPPDPPDPPDPPIPRSTHFPGQLELLSTIHTVGGVEYLRRGTGDESKHRTGARAIRS